LVVFIRNSFEHQLHLMRRRAVLLRIPTANLEEQGAASMASYVTIAEMDESSTNYASCAADPARRRRQQHLGGGRDRDRIPPPSREDIVELLRQALPPWAPRPTDEEIDFLTRKFEILEPGAALSFNPSPLGHENLNPALHLDVDVLLEPDMLFPSPDDASNQGECNGVASQRLLTRNDLDSHDPRRKVDKAVPRVWHGEEVSDLCQRQMLLQESVPRGRKRDTAVLARPPKESITTKPLAPPIPPLPKISIGRGDGYTNRSDCNHKHPSVKEALRRLKGQVKAVERLRSCIRHVNDDDGKPARPTVLGCDKPVGRRHHRHRHRPCSSGGGVVK
jgi:hypothetical protein